MEPLAASGGTLLRSMVTSHTLAENINGDPMRVSVILGEGSFQDLLALAKHQVGSSNRLGLMVARLVTISLMVEGISTLRGMLAPEDPRSDANLPPEGLESTTKAPQDMGIKKDDGHSSTLIDLGRSLGLAVATSPASATCASCSLQVLNTLLLAFENSRPPRNKCRGLIS